MVLIISLDFFNVCINTRPIDKVLVISLGSLMAAVVLCSGGSGREAVTVGPPRIATASPPPPYTGTWYNILF